MLRKATPGTVEVGIVLGPKSTNPERLECAHGWLDNPPDVGLFTVPFEHFRRGIWLIATDEDAAMMRALFLAHAGMGPRQPGVGRERRAR